jgi:hypothetical protein
MRPPLQRLISRATALALLLTPAIRPALGATARAASPRPLTLWLDWYPTSDHAGILLHAPGVLSGSQPLSAWSMQLLAPLVRDARGRYGTLAVASGQAYADWMTRIHLMATHLDARAALTSALLP